MSGSRGKCRCRRIAPRFKRHREPRHRFRRMPEPNSGDRSAAVLRAKKSGLARARVQKPRLSPDTCISATIWRFSASEYCRRFAALGCCVVSTNLVVDTCSARSTVRRSSRQSPLSSRRSSPSVYRAVRSRRRAPSDAPRPACAQATRHSTCIQPVQRMADRLLASARDVPQPV